MQNSYRDSGIVRGMKEIVRAGLMPAFIIIAGAVGCGPRDYYTQTQSGPHGTVAVQKVYYTPEQRAARNEAIGYTAPATATTQPVATDADLAAIHEQWPRLAPEQRASLARTARQMTGSP